MFEMDEIAGGEAYELVIYRKTAPDSPIISISGTSIAMLAYRGLSFNESYYWLYKAYSRSKLIFTSSRFSFSIAAAEQVGKKMLNIETPVTSKSPAKECIFLDGIGAAVNYKGEVIWKLNNPIFENNQKRQFRNIEINPQGNITTLWQTDFYELDREGGILWKTDKQGFFSNDSVEYYHHDAKRLRNGDYLLCSYRFERERCYHAPAKECIVKYGSLVQLSPDYRLQWSWSEKGHVANADTYGHADTSNTKIVGNHLNGFDVNEKTGLLLLSFRDNNRVIMIEKKTGKVVLDLKSGQTPGIEFYGQHSPMFTSDTSFVFYNNNLQGQNYKDSVFNAGVIGITFNKNNYRFRKHWEYACVSGDMKTGSSGKEGYVQMLPGNNYLIGIGGHNQVIEVSGRKEMLWKAVVTGYSKKEKTWEDITSYRNHYYSSLYPRYFTVQTRFPSGKGHVKINNDGTDDDVYEIILKGKTNRLLRTVTIRAGKSETVSLKPISGRQTLIVKPKGVEGIYREVVL